MGNSKRYGVTKKGIFLTSLFYRESTNKGTETKLHMNKLDIIVYEIA